jgi:hypothetical protein
VSAPKARVIQVQVIEAASAALLTTAVNAWLETAGEIDLQDKQFQVEGGNYVVLLWYTGGA